MVDTLVFHLGDRKTGSTSIQHTLAQRGWHCDPVSLYYPNQLNQTPLAKSLIHPKQFQFREKRFSLLEKRMTEATADVGVVSAEAFEDVPPRLFKETLETYLPAHTDNLRLIAYVRPHVDRVVSSWAQQVKMGLFAGTLEAFHDKNRSRGRFYYHDRFCQWREVFGDKFTLRLMLRDRLHKNSVVEDFFKFALQTTDFTVKEAKSNESITLEDMALLKVLHRELSKGRGHTMLQVDIGAAMARFFATLPARSTGTPPRISKSLLPEVTAAYQEDAKKMDADFFDGTPLSDALIKAADKAVDLSPSILPLDHFSKDELRSIRALAKIIVALTGEDTVDQMQHLRKQQKIIVSNAHARHSIM